MNQREAKKYVLRALAQTIQADLSVGAEYVYFDSEAPTDADVARVEQAMEELVEEFWRRAGYEKVGGGEGG